MTNTVITLDLQTVQQDAMDMARQAAPILMKHFGGPLRKSFKGSSIDVVTQADQESEALLVELIQQHYPIHHIVGEEGGGLGADVETADYRWYVDPLDGTTNFANGIPMFCISLALTDANLNPLVGVVYDPVADEMFTAVRGMGATMNDKPLTVSASTTLQECVLGSGFAYDKHTNPDNNAKEWGTFVTKVRGVRRMGAAALDLCYVAAGRFDGYWERGPQSWDCLAGALCVLEAGGAISDYQGGTDPSLYEKSHIVASNGHIHPLMLDVLNQ
jgi:myo-inositol-1(or 4)-monophosphatase